MQEVRNFKPDPAVYARFLARAGAHAADTWLISSNPFDVVGAAATGWRTVWVRRSPAQSFDPWGIEPTLEVSRLTELSGRLT